MSAYGLLDDYDLLAYEDYGQSLGSVYSLPKQAGKFIECFIIHYY